MYEGHEILKKYKILQYLNQNFFQKIPGKNMEEILENRVLIIQDNTMTSLANWAVYYNLIFNMI